MNHKQINERKSVMKTTKRITSLVLVLAMMMTLCISAYAKTDSEAIADPYGTAVVFSIQIGTKTVNFTWDEINGKGAYKTFTAEYPAKVNGELSSSQWTGVSLSDLLAAAEKKLGLQLEDSYQIKGIAADGYESSFTVADVRDAEMRYMVAADPVSNGEYGNSYVRICRGDDTFMPAQANLRCLLSIEVLDANGEALSTGTKAQSGDVENSVFYVAVQETEGGPFKFFYFTMEELEAYDNLHDFKYIDHSVSKTVTGRGVSLKCLLKDLDATITDDMIVQYAESDGYHADKDTAIEDSAYKDMVAWLGSEHVTSGGDTAAAVETVICYDSWTIYDNPDENNVNSTEWEDADFDSGYLRAYRQRDDANSAVIKTVMGIVVSPSGQVFTGSDGYTLTAKSVSGDAMRIIEPSTGKAYTQQSITGLVPGMQYAVSAPEIAGAEVSGEAVKVITAASGSDTEVSFTFKENDYLTIDGTTYTLSGLEALDAATQTPSKDEVDAHGTPYGYYDAMYYRYNGLWLKDLVSDNVTVTGTNGKTLTIAAADLGKYFVATGYTASKSSTNVSEGKRFTYAYSAPQLIIPSDGTLVGEAEAANEGNKKVTVVLDSLVSIAAGAAPAASKAPFTDVSAYPWAEEAVNTLYNDGFITGVTATEFQPTASIRRGDFMLMLVRAYGLEAEINGCFADVEEGAYYYNAIATAKALGIAKGDGENFNPRASITRQEAMTLLYRAAEAAGQDLSGFTADLSQYKDGNTVSSWAQAPIQALVGAGVINGKDGAIDPTGSMTRAELAVALYRAISLAK